MAFEYGQVVTLADQLSKAPIYAVPILRRLMTDTAQKVETAAFARVPVGETGRLRASIGTVVNGPLSRTVSATEYYGAFLEYGTARMAPQPFMSPAADQYEDSFYTACQAIIAQSLAGGR